MERKSTKLLLTVFALLLIVATSFYLLVSYKNQADTNADSIIYRGKVYLGNSQYGPPAAGAEVLLITDSDICKVKKYSATADSEGLFQITVNKPFCSCPYKVIAGGNGDYNAVDNGSVVLNNNEPMPGVDNSSALLRTNKTTQAMHSAYFGSVYTNENNGYYGNFHLSQWDTHFLRNRVSADQITQPQAPTSATFTLNIKQFFPVWSMGPDEPGGMGQKIDVILSAFAVADDSWSQSYSRPTITGVLDSKKITLDTNSGDFTGNLDFSVNFGNLTPMQRYGVWLNGFMVTFQFGETDTQTLQSWQNINPDILLPLEGPAISYSGLEKIKNSGSQLAITSDPTDSKTITCDYGYRTIGIGCHDGIDLRAPHGATVRAIADGVVESRGKRTGYGNCLTIKHCGNMQSHYCHLLDYNVSPGDYVAGGQKIARADTTGTNDSHLHFIISKDDVPYDPWYWFQGYTQEKQSACFNKGGTTDKRRESLQGSCVTNRGWEIGY